MARIIIVNGRRCLGCKTCVLECAMAHSEAETLAEAVGAETPPQPRVHVEPAGEFGVPLQCRHCEDAPCIMICPSEAISRPAPDSPVLVDPDRCIGCKFCMIVCPFGVIDVSRDGKAMIKCDLCVERTREGRQPACVSGCPTGALEFREPDDLARQRRREAARQIAAGAGRAEGVAEEGADGG